MKLFLFITVYICHCASGFNTLPPYIKLCSRSDPNFNACALKNGREVLSRFVEGDPAFLIPSFNPFKLKHVSLDTGDMVKLYATDLELHGISAIQLKDFTWDIEKKVVNLDVYVPVLDFIGTYNMKGRILIMNLSGSGPMNNSHIGNDIQLSVHYILKTDENNVDYVHVEDVDVKMTVKKVIFSFGNLLNNPQISEQMNKFLNENWRILLGELDPSIKKIFKSLIKSIANPIAAKVPFDSIVTP